jgi:excisionase family DNA binding protein
MSSKVSNERTAEMGQTKHPSETVQGADRLMSLWDVSQLLGVPIATLYAWRHRGEGPSGYRIGRHVRYRRAAVESWIEEQADDRPSRYS